MQDEITKLRVLLATIPTTGAINVARRQVILREIWRLEQAMAGA